MKFDTLIKNGFVVFPGTGIAKCDIGIKEGKIAGFFENGDSLEANTVIDASGLFVMPGAVDVHTHVGFTGEIAEDFRQESISGALGGVTSFIPYILQKDKYSNNHAQLVEMGASNSIIDFAMHYTIVSEEQINEIDLYVKEFGITSFKILMTSKGQESQRLGLAPVDDGVLFRYFSKVSESGGIPCIHCENIEVIWALQREVEKRGLDGLAAWLESRPGFTEAEAIFRAVYLAEQAGCESIYIVHLSSKEGLQMKTRLQLMGLKIRIITETCPHYLLLDIHTEAGDLAKVNPPIRLKEDNEALWKAVMNDQIEVIGSDHVTRPKSSKEGGIWKASPGFPGMGTLLPLLLDEGYHKRNLPLEKISELVSSNPAKIFNMYPKKGAMVVGADADFAIVDLDLEKEITYTDIRSSSDYSVYEGRKVKGWPVKTLVRGKVVMENGNILSEPGYGEFIFRHPGR